MRAAENSAREGATRGPTRRPVPATVPTVPAVPAAVLAAVWTTGWTTVLTTALTLAAGPAAATGDVARGAAIAASRQQGLCVLCHALPGQAAAFQGDIGPPLAGVGARLPPDLLRQRLLAPERFNPETVMPSYGRSDDSLQRVPATLRGQPLLSPAQVDDLVAWLASLK